jgi:isoleucyl-tRNA synthetase
MENLFHDLNTVTEKEKEKSVHLAVFPLVKNTWINPGLEIKMNLTKNICSSVFSLRKKEGIRVRQPLDSITICLGGSHFEEDVFVDLIKSEVNVKKVLFSNNSSTIVNRRLVVNFPVLGKKHGGKIKSIVREVEKINSLSVDSYEKSKNLILSIDGEKIILSDDDLVIKVEDMPGFLTTKTTDGLLVSLNTTISQKLLNEGFAREFINKVQNARKDLNLLVVDRIFVSISGDSKAVNMILDHEEYIKEEVLANSITLLKRPPKNHTLFEFNNYKMYIGVEK